MLVTASNETSNCWRGIRQAGDKLTVLDMSLDKTAILARLAGESGRGVLRRSSLCGQIPDHPGLTVLINTDANICSSLLMDAYLNHRFTAWPLQPHLAIISTTVLPSCATLIDIFISVTAMRQLASASITTLTVPVLTIYISLRWSVSAACGLCFSVGLYSR